MGPLASVVVIDDDPLSLRRFVGALRSGLWQVTACCGPVAALRMTASHMRALAATDVAVGKGAQTHA